jgi:hypothetical protein
LRFDFGVEILVESLTFWKLEGTSHFATGYI